MSGKYFKVKAGRPLVGDQAFSEIYLVNEDGTAWDPDEPARLVESMAPGTAFRTALDAYAAPRRPFNGAPVKAMIPACSAGHGWGLQADVSNNASSDLNDTTDFLLGSQALRITTAGTGAFVGWDKTFAAPVDASDCDLRLWIKVDAPGADLASIHVIMGDSALTWRVTQSPYNFNTATNYLQQPLQLGRWAILDVAQSSLWTPTGTPNWAAIQRILVKVSDRAGFPITVRLGGVAFIKRNHAARFPNGVATLSFDDSYASTYTYARAKMDQYGYKGTVFPIIDRLGLADKMTLAQLKAMASNGWEIAGHAYTNTNHSLGLPALSAADRDIELANINNWLVTNGFRPQVFAYPQGTHDAASEADVAAYWPAARLAILQQDTPQAPSQAFTIQAANGGSQAANLNTYITRAVAGKGWVNIILHDIMASGATGNHINQSAFDTILTNLAASGIEVRTMGEVIAALS